MTVTPESIKAGRNDFIKIRMFDGTYAQPMPGIWLAGYCSSHGNCHPREAIAYWIEQEMLKREYEKLNNIV